MASSSCRKSRFAFTGTGVCRWLLASSCPGSKPAFRPARHRGTLRQPGGSRKHMGNPPPRTDKAIVDGPDSVVASAPRSPAVMVMALGVAQIFSWGSSYYLLGALAGAMAEETGWSLAWILSGLS